MDRNLTERLKKLSKELTETQHDVDHCAHLYTEDELEALENRIEDIQDEIWDIEDQLRDEAENEYGENSERGWN